MVVAKGGVMTTPNPTSFSVHELVVYDLTEPFLFSVGVDPFRELDFTHTQERAGQNSSINIVNTMHQNDTRNLGMWGHRQGNHISLHEPSEVQLGVPINHNRTTSISQT